MPVNKTTETVNQVAAPVAQVEKTTFNLELSKIQRYHYGGNLYLKDQIYVFTEADTHHMLSLRDPLGNPVFILAKPRTRLVQIPVEQQSVKIKALDRQITDLDTFVRNGNRMPSEVAPQAPAPIGKIELGDDDAEIQAKLAQADAELVDTGAGVVV